MFARTAIAVAAISTLAACATSPQAAIDPGAPLITGPIHTFKTEQGFTVVLARAQAGPDTEQRAIAGLYTREGATTEPVPGIAHMGEHLYANSHYPTSNPPMPEGSTSLNSNAQARSDYVSMWLTVNRPDDSDAAAIGLAARYASRAWGPEIDDELIETQRQRVIVELTRGLGSGNYRSQRALRAAFHGAQTSLEEEIALTEAYEADDLRAYLAHAFRPENIVVILAGDFDPDAARDALTEIFAERGPITPSLQDPDPAFAPLPDRFIPDPGPILITSEQAEGDWLAMGFPVVAETDRERAALLVLDQLLLGGRGEFDSLWRIRRSLDSPVGAHLSGSGPIELLSDNRGYGAAIPPLAERDPAYFTIQFAANEMAPGEAGFEAAQARLLEALESVRETGLTEDAVRTAKLETLDFYRRWLNTQDLRPLSDHLAGLAMQDPARPALIQRLHEEIAAVTPRDVRRAFDAHIRPDAMRWAYVDGHTPESEAETE